MFDPKQLDGNDLVFDKTTGKEISKDDLQNSLNAYYEDIQIMALIESGKVTMGLKDYLDMPLTGRQALNVYRKVTAGVKPKA